MIRKVVRVAFHSRFLCPKGLLLRAAIIAIAFAVLHALGCRENTSIICGTWPAGQTPGMWTAGMGVAYILLYFGFILATPIFLLAGCMMFAWQYLRPAHGPDKGSTT
jgi:hypothetical protein